MNLNDYKNEINESTETNLVKKDDDEKNLIFKDFDYSEVNSDLNRVKNFTFIRSPKDEDELEDD